MPTWTAGVGTKKSRAGLRIVSFPAGIVPELHRHLDCFAGDGPSGLVFPNQHGRPYRRGNFNKAVGWAEVRERLGVPDLHLHDLRHAGNTFAAQSGASLRAGWSEWATTLRCGTHLPAQQPGIR